MAEETRMIRHEPDREMEALKAEIHQTRMAMGDTIAALQERLDPTRLKDQATESVREATIGRVQKMARTVGDRAGHTSRSVVDVVRDNPLPLAIIGVGAGLLFMNRRRSHAREGYGRELRASTFRGYADTEREPIGYEAGEVPERYRGVYTSREFSRGVSYPGEATTGREGEEEGLRERARERAGEVTDRARETMHGVQDKARATTENVRERVSDVRENVQERASHLAQVAEERTRGIRSSAEHTMHRAEQKYQESPWAGGVFALALGAAAGLALPSTRKEQELMGSRRDHLFDRAREKGREKIDQARTVFGEVASDARESAREHSREEGLTGGRGGREEGGTRGFGEGGGTSGTGGSSGDTYR